MRSTNELKHRELKTFDDLFKLSRSDLYRLVGRTSMIEIINELDRCGCNHVKDDRDNKDILLTDDELFGMMQLLNGSTAKQIGEKLNTSKQAATNRLEKARFKLVRFSQRHCTNIDPSIACQSYKPLTVIKNNKEYFSRLLDLYIQALK